MRLRSLFNLISLGAFLAFSSLGAGSGKRMRKPLGAHQEKILIAIKENTAVLIVQTKLRTVYGVSCLGKFNITRFLQQSHHSIICVVSLLSFINSLLCSKKQEESSPK
jgi:hypothetical protein